jgi:hypothetical protein
VDFVSFEMFPDAISPTKQIENIRTGFQVEKAAPFLARDFAPVYYTLAQVRYPGMDLAVNFSCAHG